MSETAPKKLMKRPTRSTRPKDVSDSDSAPENMSFSTGRQLVMESLKNAVDSIQREKRRIKEKRKQRFEKYKQQKEEKLIRLKEKRASQEDASCSSSEESGYEEVDVSSANERSNRKKGLKPEKENLGDLQHSQVRSFHSSDEAESQERKEKKRKHEQKDVAQDFGNLKKLPSDVLEHLPDQIPVKLRDMDSEAASKEGPHEKHNKSGDVKDKRQASGFRYRNDVDYIPLSTCGATEFGVMPLDNLMRAPKSMAERAAEFRQKMLFGDRIRRGQANAQIIYQQKLKASGKGRLVK